MTADLQETLAQMPALGELFRWFLSGKQLNRMAEPALWAELERQQVGYACLFAALGFELRVDARGFAWFHNGDASSNISKISRQLALLFMVIFEAQANAGRALQRFTEWRIDSAVLTEIYKQQQDLLDAEGLDPQALIDLLDRARNLGFAVAEHGGWRLLPAVFRYLDHFESLAQAARGDEEDAADAADEQGEDEGGSDRIDNGDGE
jgi:hypothetical protein